MAVIITKNAIVVFASDEKRNYEVFIDKKNCYVEAFPEENTFLLVNAYTDRPIINLSREDYVEIKSEIAKGFHGQY